MRERVRQVWPEPQAGAVPARRRLLSRLRAFLRRDGVAEALSRTFLQAMIAGIIVAVAAVVRWLPVQALDPMRTSVARLATRDYTVTEAWRDASRWAAARGGWIRLIRDSYAAADGKIRLWASDLLPPGLTDAGAKVTTPPIPSPGAAAPGTGATGTREAGTGAGATAGTGVPGVSETGPTREPPARVQVPTGQPPGLITLERPGPGAPPSSAPAGSPPAGRDSTGQGSARGGVRPVPGRVVSAFGWRERPRGGGEELHEGLDLAARTGDPVRALRPGVVARVGRDPLVGPFVEIDHGKGLSTRYAPMSRVDVKVGARVEAGQVLGAVGSPPPGEPGSPHLHLEVRQDGRAVDPAPLLGGGPGV